MNRYAQRVQELGGKPYPDTSPVGATEEELAEVERRLGAELPADYREFLSGFGGYEIDMTFPVKGQFPVECRESLSEFNDVGVDAPMISDELPYPSISRDWEGRGETLWFNGIFNGQVLSGDNVSHYKYGVVEVYENLRGMDDDWPEEWLPISSHYNPGFVVIKFKGERRGIVSYIYDPSLSVAGFVTNSFDEFIQLVRPDRDA